MVDAILSCSLFYYPSIFFLVLALLLSLPLTQTYTHTVTTGEVVGVIEVMNKNDGRQFTPTDIQVLDCYATQAGIAIENVQLFQQLYKMEKYVNSVTPATSNIALEIGLDGKVKRVGCDPEEALDVSKATMMNEHFSTWLGQRNETLHDALSSSLNKQGGRDTFTFANVVYASPKGQAITLNATICPKLGRDYEILGVIMLLDNIQKTSRMIRTVGK